MGPDNEFYAQVQLLYPWLPVELAQIYAEAWADTGDPDIAWALMQQSDIYDTYFAGNRREDGTLRYTEFEYMTALDAYEDIFETIGLNPALFADQFVDWIEADLSPDEIWQERISPIVDRVLDASPQIRQYYADTWGLELTDEAIIAAAINPDLGERIINQQIGIAEIGGEAATRGFNISALYAESLLEHGLSRQGAQELFGQAAGQVPVLDVLAKRHLDPDDDFDIHEFTNAMLLDDPFQRRRMRRLLAQERALFSSTVGMGQLHAGDQENKMTGLAVR